MSILLSALFWRLRGIIGWPGTLLFALVQVFTLYPLIGGWSWLFGLSIMAGEPTGWKPKAIWDSGDWRRSALLGARIGLIGAIAVPLSTWMADVIPDPQIKALQNPREFNLPFWSSKKQLLNWRGAWNEVYFGAIFSTCLLIGIEIFRLKL